MANELSLAQKLGKMPAKNTNGGLGPKKKSINLFPCVEKTQAKLFCPLVSLHKVHQCTESFCIFFFAMLEIESKCGSPLGLALLS